jgi:2-polyprenyl-6-methoxyphenol hydroxylase-like FAD-dependent oxidoreductase
MTDVTPSRLDALALDGDGRAVVIGGGVAGLAVARVLAKYVRSVALVERDVLPSDASFRSGVPQSRHVHALFARGRQLLDRLFPGLGADLIAAGAVPLEWPADIVWHSPFGWGGRFQAGIRTYSASRELLEWGVRRRLADDPRITILQGYQVTGLVTDPGGERISGVTVRRRGPRDGASEAEETTVRAGLVVDASGRESQAPRWLEALGYPTPDETVVNSFLGYATRYYARPRDEAPPWKGVVVQRRRPDGTRSGVLMPLEGDRWILTLAGAARDYPPNDEDGFLQFARDLNHPIIHDQIKGLEAESPIWSYRRTENRLRHFSRLSRRPEGFIVLGDAACAFNPVYGQGMTIAVLGASTLARCLRAHRASSPAGDWSGFAGRFQIALDRDLKLPWLMATGEDFRYPVTEGPRPGRLSKISHRYFDRLMEVSVTDAVVHRTFLEVVHLLRPPLALVQPQIVARVLWSTRQRPRADLPGVAV